MSNTNTHAEVRIGMVNYINTAPIYEPWKEQPNHPGWLVTEAPPSTLNRMLAAGELDLGFVSSYEYSVHPELYAILPDLSISASGPVGSVFLLSRQPIADLSEKRVLLTSQSETSVMLTKVVLEEFYGVKPEYRTGDVQDGEQQGHCQALLAIGDDALRLAAGGKFTHQLDLGELWNRHTSLPFVFAVCAVRKEFCNQQPELLASVHERLLQCRMQGSGSLKRICSLAAPRIPMDVAKCYDYLKGIEYDLGEEKQQALSRFFGYLINRGEASPAALPLNIHNFK